MINRKLIRTTLREIGAKADVDFLRKVRDNVVEKDRKRPNYNAFICCASDDVASTTDYDKAQNIRFVMQRFIDKFEPQGYVLENAAKHLDNGWEKGSIANNIRKVVLQELIDMNRNRKGSKGVKC